MMPEMPYNIWKEGVYQKERKRLKGKIALPAVDRPFVYTDDNIEMFAAERNKRLGEIYRYIIIGYSNGGNWNSLLEFEKRRMDYLLTDYINRLVESKQHEVDDIIELGEKWVEITTDIIDEIIEEQKQDVYKKSTYKGTLSTTVAQRRIDALEGVRDALVRQMQRTQDTFLKDLMEIGIDGIGPDPIDAPAPKPKPGKKGRGKPRKSFSEFIVDQTKVDTVTTELKSLIGDKKGSDAYIILAAAVKAGIITRPAYSAVEETFGHLGASSGFNAKMADRGFTAAELKPIIEQLKNLA